MPTANELLNAALGEESIITVDFSTRSINIPETIRFLGVESDDDILPLHFQMPKTYQGVDLSTFDMNINYLNAQAQGDVYDITDAKVEGEYILFTWKVGRFAAQYAGNVQFNVCLKEMDKADPTIVTRELNTTVASLPVLKGLETDDRILQEHADVLRRWEQEIFGIGDTLVGKLNNAFAAEKAQVSNSIVNLAKNERESIATLAETERSQINGMVEAKTNEQVVITVNNFLEQNTSLIITNDEINTLMTSLK